MDLTMSMFATKEDYWKARAKQAEALLNVAGDACIDFYMKTHVSVMREQTEPLKKLWSIGQELYLKKRRSENKHK